MSTDEPTTDLQTIEDADPLAPNAMTRGQLWHLSQSLAQSPLVPKHFQGRPGDCYIMADLAQRMDAPILPILQGTYIVHGKPGFEGKLTAALLEGSGRIVGPIDYETTGDIDSGEYGCRAIVQDRSLEKQIQGPWVTWKIVKAERWDAKEGSKWKTIPELMFCYRAASWLVRTRYAGVLMGMNTVDELEDGREPKAPTPQNNSLADLTDRLKGPDSPPDAPGADQAPTDQQRTADACVLPTDDETGQGGPTGDEPEFDPLKGAKAAFAACTSVSTLGRIYQNYSAMCTDQLQKDVLAKMSQERQAEIGAAKSAKADAEAAE